jgi:hypothetical protein
LIGASIEPVTCYEKDVFQFTANNIRLTYTPYGRTETFTDPVMNETFSWVATDYNTLAGAQAASVPDTDNEVTLTRNP